MSQLTARRAAPRGPQRARSDAAKDARRTALLAAARALLADRPFAELAMSAVADRAGVAKGTVFLYFPTKEALGLAVVEEWLDEWFDALDSRLGTLRARASAARVAEAVVAVTLARPRLVELLALLGPLLEQNVPRAAAESFKARVLVRSIQLGAALERVLPALAPGEGLQCCLVIHALVIGIHQQAAPAPIIREVLADETFAPLRVDFASALQHTLTAYFLGRDRAEPLTAARPARRSR